MRDWRLESGDESDSRRPRKRNARCSKEASSTVRVRSNRETLLAAHGRGPESSQALDNEQGHRQISYCFSIFPLLRYCGRVVMASRLGPDQSVMGNLASSNLVSANLFSCVSTCVQPQTLECVLQSIEKAFPPRTLYFYHAVS